MILESMKMEIPVLAEGSGVVTKMHVAEGDVVPGRRPDRHDRLNRAAAPAYTPVVERG